MFHVFLGDVAAKFIGWENSPFQAEVGFASLGVGIAGVVAFKASLPFRFATLIPPWAFSLGAAGGHIYQMIVAHNFSPGERGTGSPNRHTNADYRFCVFVAFLQTSTARDRLSQIDLAVHRKRSVCPGTSVSTNFSTTRHPLFRFLSALVFVSLCSFVCTLHRPFRSGLIVFWRWRMRGNQALHRVNSEAQWNAMTGVTPEHDAAARLSAPSLPRLS